MKGWILLNKQLLKWGWWDDPLMVKAWMWLLLKVNFEKTVWKGIVIERGETILTYPMMVEALLITQRQARTIVKRLKATGEVTVKTTNKYSLLRVVKYDDYQTVTDKVTGKRQTKQGSSDSSIKNKDLKEVKEKTLKPLCPKKMYGEIVKLTTEEHQRLIETFTEKKVNEMIERMDDYLVIHGKTYKNYNKAIHTWFKNEIQKHSSTTVVKGLFND